MGKHPYQATDADRARVKRLASFGLPHAEIALLVTNRQTGKPIAIPTLVEHFPDELGIGKLELFAGTADSYCNRLVGAKAQVDEHGNIVRAEVLPSETAQERYLRNWGRQYGWDGPVDDPFAGWDISKLTDAELQILHTLKAKAGKPGSDT
jgi:hypothetical protein